MRECVRCERVKIRMLRERQRAKQSKWRASESVLEMCGPSEQSLLASISGKESMAVSDVAAQHTAHATHRATASKDAPFELAPRLSKTSCCEKLCRV